MEKQITHFLLSKHRKGSSHTKHDAEQTQHHATLTGQFTAVVHMSSHREKICITVVSLEYSRRGNGLRSKSE